MRSDATRSLASLGVVLVFSAVAGAEEKAEYDSGDLRALAPDEIHTVWDTLTTVKVWRDTRTPSSFQKPDAKRRLYSAGDFFVEYGKLSDYVAKRHAEMAHELGLRAWSIPFEGGPYYVWYDVETSGGAAVPGDLITGDGIYLTSVAEKGRLVFMVMPVATPRMKSERSRRLADLIPHDKRFPESNDGIEGMHGLRLANGTMMERGSASGAERVWWADWHGVRIERLSKSETFRSTEEDGILIDLKLTETDVPKDSTPKGIRIRLRAKPEPKKVEVDKFNR